MLLTYEEFAEIPQKMHVFYGQAFDTLFRRHDAQKEQFDRDTYSNLAREDFKTCFAAFCALSYLTQQFSFDDGALLRVATRAVEYARQTSDNFNNVNGTQLIADLRESVCMLQPDGTETTFVHRSFQEYFAADFAVNANGKDKRRILDQYAVRAGDSVLPMALEMSRGAVEQEWVLPSLESLETEFDFSNEEITTGWRFAVMFPVVIFHRVEGGPVTGFLIINIPVFSLFDSLCRLYFDQLKDAMILGHLLALNLRESQQKLSSQAFSEEKNFAIIQKFFEDPDPRSRDDRHIKFRIDKHDSWWLNCLGVQEAFDIARVAFKEIKADIQSRASNRSTILDDVFKTTVNVKSIGSGKKRAAKK